MLVNLKSTYDMLYEDANMITVTERQASSNYFKHFRPESIIISDTYNHPLYPISTPQIDRTEIDLFIIKKQFSILYAGTYNISFLPWHYIIELINDKYVVFNTRPIDKIFPEKTAAVIDKLKYENEKRNLINHAIEIQNSIHIGIIGDTNKDIYTTKFYKTLTNICIAPHLRLFKLNKSVSNSVFTLNIGQNFKYNLLQQYL